MDRYYGQDTAVHVFLSSNPAIFEEDYYCK